MERTLGRIPAALLVALLLLTIHPAAGASFHTYRPGPDAIVGYDVRDIAEGQDGTIAFATSSGLSLFDGEWYLHKVYTGVSLPLRPLPVLWRFQKVKLLQIFFHCMKPLT